MQTSYDKSSGFTIVEIAVVVTVISLLTGVVLQTLGGFYNDNVISLGKTSQDTNTRGVLRSIEKEIMDSGGFVTDAAVAKPLGRDDGTSWSYRGNDPSLPGYDAGQKTNRVLMATTTATDKAATDDKRLPVFIDSGSGCDFSVSPIAQNLLVYFVAKNTTTGKYDLYRRTITNYTGGTLCNCATLNPNPSGCKTPYQSETCSNAALKSGTYSGTCKLADADLLRDIDSFTVDYYTSPETSTPIVNEYNGTTATKNLIKAAKAIKITVGTDDFINGKLVLNTATIRISLGN